METIHSIDLISSDPAVRQGRPCIAGTTIEVAVIAVAKVVQGLSADEIATDYELPLSHVYAALSYYYQHKQAIDATIHERHKLAQAMKEKGLGSRRPPLSR